MKTDRKINLLIFPVLLFVCIALLAWVSTRNILVKDFTSNNRLSLTQPSLSILEKMKSPVEIDVYVNRSDQIGKQVDQLLSRYKKIKKDIQINFISPEENPDKVRENNIRYPAEMLIKYQGKTEHLEKPSEQSITNTMAKLLRGNDRWIVFVTGHGERDAMGNANFDLGSFRVQLEKRGLKFQTLNLTETNVIPDNTAILILADPKVDLLHEEFSLIENYINKGGNFLWMTEPDQRQKNAQLKELLGFDHLPGVIVDAVGQTLNITQPDLIPIIKYSDHEITKKFKLTTLFPQALALEVDGKNQWNSFPIIFSSENSWNEMSKVADLIDYNEGLEQRGPLTIIMALTSPKNEIYNESKKDQRILISGDSDFISNSYLANGGNLDLGMRMINWLTGDDELISIPARPATDLDFELSKVMSSIIGLGFLIILPLCFAATGLIIWWRRRSL
ncbi:MAG: GldG family protein [Gammaproteobacteria bacterium]